MTAPLAILSALPRELDSVVTALPPINANQATWGRSEIHENLLDGCPIVTMATGVGKVRAAAATQHLIDAYRPRLVLLFGAAGSLHSLHGPSDIIVGDTVIEYDFDDTILAASKRSGPRQWSVDDAIHRRLRRAALALSAQHVQVSGGIIVTGDKVVQDSTERNRLRTVYGGDCADMESAAVAAICEMNGTEFGVVRIISDSAEKDLRELFLSRLDAISRQILALTLSYINEERDSSSSSQYGTVPAAL